MLPLLVALILSQGQHPLPVLAVTEFCDLKAGEYGLAASKAVTERLAKAQAYDILPDEAVRRAMATLGLTPPLVGLVDLSRVGTEAMGAERSARGGTIVTGEVVDYRIDRSSGGKQARLALRVVAYDVAGVLPVNGALELGLPLVHKEPVTDDELLTEALQHAAELAVRTMRGYKVPTATIVETQTRFARLDHGSDEGFRTGDIVSIARGPIAIGTGRVSRVEPECAELSFERVIAGIALGDRVRRVFTPPPLPPAGKSIFGGKC